MSNLKTLFEEIGEKGILPLLDNTHIITTVDIPSDGSYIFSTLNGLESIFEQVVEDGSVEINYKFKCDSDILKNIFEKYGFSFLIKADNLTLFLSDTDLSDETLEHCNVLYCTLNEEESEEDKSEEDKSEEEKSEEEKSEEEKSEEEKSEEEKSEEEKSEDEESEEENSEEENSEEEESEDGESN